MKQALFLKLLSLKGSGGYREGCKLDFKPGGRSSSNLSLADAIETAKGHASRYLSQIAKAEFTVLPFSEKSCRQCDFKPLCRHQKLRLRERATDLDEGEGED